MTLCEAHVQLECRLGGRPLTEADQAAFPDSALEATEASEDAVVGQEAQVGEEEVVRKEPASGPRRPPHRGGGR